MLDKPVKVGDKVTVMGGMDGGPSAIRVVSALSPKRGDITLEDYSIRFDSSGRSIGTSRWHHIYIQEWIPEHTEAMKKKHIDFVNKSVDLKEISEEDKGKIYEILKPYYDKAKADKENKTS